MWIPWLDHDWYLSSNISNDKNLDNHLLPGLDSKGVPRALMNTTLPFNYNDIEGLEKLINTLTFGAIKMEVLKGFKILF